MYLSVLKGLVFKTWVSCKNVPHRIYIIFLLQAAQTWAEHLSTHWTWEGSQLTQCSETRLSTGGSCCHELYKGSQGAASLASALVCETRTNLT